MLPRMVRCSMNGCASVFSAVRYVRSKRCGKLKSTWIVEDCQVRPMASLSLMSIFGP